MCDVLSQFHSYTDSAGWHTLDLVNMNGLDESCCYRPVFPRANRDVSGSISRSDCWPALHTNLYKIHVKFLARKTSESFTYYYSNIRKAG